MTIMVFPNRRFFLLLALAESAQVGLIQICKPLVGRAALLTARIGRAPSERARSASKKDSLAAPFF